MRRPREGCNARVYVERRDASGGLVNIHGPAQQKGGDSHDEQHGDGVSTANGDEIWGIGIVTGANDVNDCAMVVSEVHRTKREAVTAHWRQLSHNHQSRSMPRRSAPNPALFAAVALSSFAAYYTLVHHRAATSPASSRRPNDHPLVWPVHTPDQDRDGTQLRREDR